MVRQLPTILAVIRQDKMNVGGVSVRAPGPRASIFFPLPSRKLLDRIRSRHNLVKTSSTTPLKSCIFTHDAPSYRGIDEIPVCVRV